MINTWFKFEGKIQNTSKVIMFTRNNTDDDDNDAYDTDDADDGTKNNMSPPSRGGGGQNIIPRVITLWFLVFSLFLRRYGSL